ncbi:FAD-binding oxidoreductase [uncultured Maritimibacter sp.]|uniref:NAD(P)/FAD-dependent oxidoreductase n=1 Tax=uncultured Maritimibacter sp. TaxID=991866 RepID=UPI000AAC1A7F|nr:FAD-dependent oxidoreductase [uncultured Maritimibacter sp.]
MTRLYEDFAYGDGPRVACAWSLSDGWPVLEADLGVEVAVIGGGFTGLSAALHLAQAGTSVAVLEAQTPGWGASGRNGGFCCMGGAKVEHATLARRHGTQAADDFLRAEVAAIDLVEAITNAHGIDVNRHSDGEMQLAHHPRAALAFDREAATLARIGVATERLSQGALAERGLGMTGTHGGLHVRAGFALDPGLYVAGLARAARDAGAQVFARAPVTTLDRGAGGWRLATPGGTVTAQRVILATNGYSSDNLPRWMAGRFLPVQSSALMTRPLTPDEQAAQGWTSDLMAYDTRTLLHYFRKLPDGRFLFGMRGGIRSSQAAEAATRARLLRHFHRLFPAWQSVEVNHSWSGLACLARRFTPHVGPVPGMEGVTAAFAYHGNGVAMGSYCGALAAGLTRGEDRRPEVIATPPGRFPLGRFRRLLLAGAYAGYTIRDAL